MLRRNSHQPRQGAPPLTMLTPLMGQVPHCQLAGSPKARQLPIPLVRQTTMMQVQLLQRSIERQALRARGSNLQRLATCLSHHTCMQALLHTRNTRVQCPQSPCRQCPVTHHHCAVSGMIAWSGAIQRVSRSTRMRVHSLHDGKTLAPMLHSRCRVHSSSAMLTGRLLRRSRRGARQLTSVSASTAQQCSTSCYRRRVNGCLKARCILTMQRSCAAKQLSRLRQVSCVCHFHWGSGQHPTWQPALPVRCNRCALMLGLRLLWQLTSQSSCSDFQLAQRLQSMVMAMHIDTSSARHAVGASL